MHSRALSHVPVAGTAPQPAGTTDVELAAREHTAPASTSAPAIPPTSKGAMGSLPEEGASPEAGIRQRSRRRFQPSEGQEAAQQPGAIGRGEGEPLIASAGGLLQVPLEQRPFKQWLERETVETRCHAPVCHWEPLVSIGGCVQPPVLHQPFPLTSAEINLQQQLPCCVRHQMPTPTAVQVQPAGAAHKH